MKLIFPILAIILTISTNGWTQANIIQQKANGIRDANNARQAAMNGTSAPAPVVSAPAVGTAPPSIPNVAGGAEQMKAVNQLVGDLSAFKAGVTVSPEKQNAIINDLMALSKVGIKPTRTMMTNLVKNLGTALSEKVLPMPELRSLCGCLSGVMNASNLPAARAASMVTRSESLLKGAGISAEATTGVTKSLGEIVALMQKNKSDLYK